MEKILLSNGLTVAFSAQPHSHSAAISICVASGNRFEPADKQGIAHFIEHMVFKGTDSRTAAEIAEESDLMGGQLNAYTAKEYTCFYSRALREHLSRTLHLMCDMLCNPLFDPKDIEAEKGVVLEEIGMYEDTPEDLCSDMLNALCYKNKPLGFNILGTRESVSGFTADGLREFMATAYAPERTVISICGSFDRDECLEIIESYFGRLKNTGNPLSFEKDTITDGFTLCNKKQEQTQVSLCFNGLPIGHELRFPAAFFSSAAGGSSSSRINLRIREELGLAYSVYTFSSSYLGTGMFGISGGLAHKNQERFLRESLRVLRETREGITDGEVDRTKEQFKAGLVLANDNMASTAASVGRQLLLEGEYIDLSVVLKQLEAVTAEQVREAARLITDPETVAFSAVGNTNPESFYKGLLEELLQF